MNVLVQSREWGSIAPYSIPVASPSADGSTSAPKLEPRCSDE